MSAETLRPVSSLLAAPSRAGRDARSRRPAKSRLARARGATVSRNKAKLGDIRDTERHLLFVAISRARDEIAVAGVAPAAEFLDDLGHLRR